MFNVGKDRLREVQMCMEKHGIDGLIVYSLDDVFYLTGITIEPCFVLVVPMRGDPIGVVVDVDVEEAKRQSRLRDVQGFHFVQDADGTPSRKMFPYEIKKALKNLKTDTSKVGVIGISPDQLEYLRTFLSDAQLIDASNLILDMRMVKSDEEAAMIRKASEIADRGMAAAASALRAGVTELEVAAEAEYVMKKLGSQYLRARTIVASGSRATISHPYPTEKRLEQGELVIIDLHPTYQRYRSDLARTFIIGDGGEAQKRLLNLALKVQLEALKAVKPGNKMGDIAEAAYKLVPYNPSAATYFGGHLGHVVGMGEWQPEIGRDVTVELKEGMVIALCEGSIITKGIGARFEDTILITENGAEPLTSYPKST